MAIHIIQIDKHRFVCGLFWQSLSRRSEHHEPVEGIFEKDRPLCGSTMLPT